MTALAGFLSFGSGPEPHDACVRMLAGQRMLAPHGSDVWQDGPIALGRGLFRILDEDRYDRQPLAGGGGRFRLIGDVRLDDRAALAEALSIDAGAAATMADSALLLAAWERWGEAAPERLYGDYAFAVWDAERRQLFLVRDGLGAKPLHYHRAAGFLAFASMPKGLHALPEIERAPDEERVAELLATFPEHGARSFFAGVSRVEAGQIVTIEADGRIRMRRHWEPRPTILRLPHWRDYADALGEQLDRAVASRLRGAGSRVGAHLSAGLDSSAVATSAARQLAGAGGKVLAFTAIPRRGWAGPVPDGMIADESALAARTAAACPNIEHVTVPPDGRPLIDDLDRDVFLFDRPVVNPGHQRWMNAINDAARARGVSVLLTAAMGNLSFSYLGTEGLAELVARGRWIAAARHMLAMQRNGRTGWLRLFGYALGPWVPERLWIAASGAFGASKRNDGSHSALSAERRRALDLAGRARALGFTASFRPHRDSAALRLWGLRRVDQGNHAKGVLGGWGIDLRDPSADRRLVELCLSFPPEAWLGDGRPRTLARQMLAGRVPPEVANETRRGLQAADWHEALTDSRARLAEEVRRLGDVPAAAAALDLPRLGRLVEDWPEDGWERMEIRNAYGLALLRGAAAGHFLRKASGSNA